MEGGKVVGTKHRLPLPLLLTRGDTGDSSATSVRGWVDPAQSAAGRVKWEKNPNDLVSFNALPQRNALPYNTFKYLGVTNMVF